MSSDRAPREIRLRRLRASDPDFAERRAELCRRGAAVDDAVERAVGAIVEDVRRRGDAAVRELTERFDGRSPDPSTGSYEVGAARWRSEAARVAPEVAAALERAAARIADFHRPQEIRRYSTRGGSLALRAVPLERVGLYAPGGTARYPSSVLMTAVPARLAGVDQIVLVTPGASPETLLAARIAGVDRVFEIGGAQAIAALATGTETVPRVDKIVGPGNQYVAAAKRLVFGLVDIDSIAGPSEVMIVADGGADPRLVAADLLAQAEHDAEAHVVLVVTDEAVVDRVERELGEQLASLPRAGIAAASLAQHGAAVVVGSIDEAVALANEFAPEHLELMVDGAAALAERVRHAGAIFVGAWSPEAAGDYVAGPNHVLPTGGAARWASPLGVYDFVKRVSVLHLSEGDLADQAGDIALLAGVEGLEAHARSVAMRIPDPGPRAAATPPSVLDRVRVEVRALGAYEVPHPDGVVAKLDANELPFALPADVAGAMAAELGRIDLNRYPDHDQRELRDEISAWLGVAPESLLFGNGSDEILQLLVCTVAQPRPGRASAGIAYPVPTFGLFRTAALAAGCEPVEVPLEDDFSLDFARLGAVVERERPNLVFLARPNNPTGSLWPSRGVAELARSFPDMIVVSDEAYSAYASDSMVAMTRDLPNLVVMQTLSKIGLAALRVGYLHGDPALIAEVNKVRSPYNVGALNQRAAVWALRNARPVLEAQCAEVVRERERVSNALGRLDGLRVFPSHANLILFRVGRPGDGRATRVWEHLCRRGVLIRSFDRPGPLSGCLRATLGTRAENDLFLAAIDEALAAG